MSKWTYVSLRRYVKCVLTITKLYIMKTMYSSLIASHLQHCPLLWANAYVSNIRQLQLLQKKAIRIITSSHYIAHTDPLFSITKCLKLYDLYKYQLGVLMAKLHTSNCHNICHQCSYELLIYTVKHSETTMHNQTNKNKHQEIHNKLFWTEILEHSSCQSLTTCFHTPV